MPGSIDNLIPSAKQIRKDAALKEAEKAEQYARLAAAAEAEKRALIERLNRPSGKSEEEKIQLASTIIQRAVRNGMTEVQVYRFPNSLCTDKGNIPTLDRLPETAGVSHQLPGDRLPGRRAGRHRHHHFLGRLRHFGQIRVEQWNGEHVSRRIRERNETQGL